MFDNSDAVSLELLRFRRELAVAPGFDSALREAVERLAGFRHPTFSDVRAVVYLDEHDLTLVSTYISGQRLSQRSRKPLPPAVVTALVQELLPALAAFHASAPAAAHGALTADRVVFKADGGLCILEHALGVPLQRLGLSPAVLWREFGILTLPDSRGVARIDPRTDVLQLGTIALSLLLARAVTLDDLEHRLPALLDEFSAMASARRSVLAESLRVWLEHALQLSPHSYRSAADAQEGLKELEAASMYELTGQEEHVNDGGPIARVGMPTPRRFHPPDKINGDHDWSRVDAPGESLAARRPEPRRRRFVPSAWVMAALAAIAVAEGVAIARFATARVVPAAPSPVVMIESTEPGDTVTVDGQRVGQTPLRLTVNGRTRAIRLARADNPVPILAVTAASEPAPSEAAAIEHAAARQRSGGVRFASPIDLQVLEGDRVLGSTADGPIVATAGTHQLDLINAALGYRAHQTVTIRAGVLIPVTITPPMGRLSINAEPWAQVFIDDKLIGDTPLANVAVSLGQHQVTFRNPQAGERRETVTIRADAPARVSTTFQR